MMNENRNRKTGNTIPILDAVAGTVREVVPVVKTDEEWQAASTHARTV
jgi:hypothetical protein